MQCSVFRPLGYNKTHQLREFMLQQLSMQETGAGRRRGDFGAQEGLGEGRFLSQMMKEGYSPCLGSQDLPCPNPMANKRDTGPPLVLISFQIWLRPLDRGQSLHSPSPSRGMGEETGGLPCSRLGQGGEGDRGREDPAHSPAPPAPKGHRPLSPLLLAGSSGFLLQPSLSSPPSPAPIPRSQGQS